MSQLSIKVNIAGRTYPLTIERSEEEMIRKVADNINASIKNLKENYAVKHAGERIKMYDKEKFEYELYKRGHERPSSSVLKTINQLYRESKIYPVYYLRLSQILANK